MNETSLGSSRRLLILLLLVSCTYIQSVAQISQRYIPLVAEVVWLALHSDIPHTLMQLSLYTLRRMQRANRLSASSFADLLRCFDLCSLIWGYKLLEQASPSYFIRQPHLTADGIHVSRTKPLSYALQLHEKSHLCILAFSRYNLMIADTVLSSLRPADVFSIRHSNDPSNILDSVLATPVWLSFPRSAIIAPAFSGQMRCSLRGNRIFASVRD